MFTNDTIGEGELLFIVLSGTETAFLLLKRVGAVVSSKFLFGLNVTVAKSKWRSTKICGTGTVLV